LACQGHFNLACVLPQPFTYFINFAVLGFELKALVSHFSHTPNPFSFSLFLPMLALDHDLPTSSVAGITAVHHHSHFLTPFLKNRHFFGEGSIGV
jgi:hypothetical protein